MSENSDSSGKGGGTSSGFNFSASGSSSTSESNFFRRNKDKSSASAGPEGSGGFSSLDFDSLMERYAEQAFSKLVTDIERRHAEKALYIEQAQETITTQIDQSGKMLKSLQAGLDSSTKLINKTIEDRGILESEITSVKANAVTALSIFVSFFAFITVSINVFSKATNVISAMILLTVFWCLLIGFNILISMRFKTNGGGWAYWLSLVLVVFVSFASIALASKMTPTSMGQIIHYLT